LREGIVMLLLLFALLGTLALIFSHRGGGDVKNVLGDIDQSVVSLRHGNESGAKNFLSRAKNGYVEKIHLLVENVDEELDGRILRSFDSCISSPSEENVFSLRDLVVEGVREAGLSIPLTYGYGTLLVLAVSFLFALLVTLLTKCMVDWERVKQIKAEVSAWQRELRDAQRKRDMKRAHKLMLEQKHILSLQGEIMKSTFRPTLVYLVPWLLIWASLGRVYSGWVMAWLPFTIPLPFYGHWTSCGFLGWLFVTYFTLSYMCRRILIGD